MSTEGAWAAPDAASRRIAPRLSVQPGPTAEEAAAIVAALDALWPRPAVVVPAAPLGRRGAWRFSGRWWTRPVPARRARPW
jgi:hypothetical protein